MMENRERLPLRHRRILLVRVALSPSSGNQGSFKNLINLEDSFSVFLFSPSLPYPCFIRFVSLLFFLFF